MKLYIKANSLKILKNIDTLLYNTISKTTLLLDESSNLEYKANVQSAKEIKRVQEQLFYDTRELDKIIKGIYFGNSSCEHLLPHIKDIVEAKNICEQKHYNFVFVFPAISQNRVEDVEFICKFLAQKPKSEVVVNDIGVLNLALKHKLKPILGLNFTKIIKNAFLDSVVQTDITNQQFQNQKELLTHSEFELQEVREFYKSLGVGRFGVENIAFDFEFLDKVPRFQVDFYYPYISIANSKACDIAGSFEDERGYFVYDECSKYCNFASLEFKNSEITGLRQRYNTVYKTSINLDMPKIVYKNDRNRLIWEVFL